MMLITDLFSRIGTDAITLKLAAVLSLMCLQTFAESSIPPIDDRCEISKAFVSFDRSTFRLCDVELNECIAARMSRFNESEELAQDQCWRLPLPMDPNFDGPCPEYMEELEHAAPIDQESITRLILMRNYFKHRNEDAADIDVLRRSESLRRIRSLLANDPNNVIALELLSGTLLYTDDLVESLNVDLKIQGLDPDCPNSRNLFLHGIYQRTDEIVENWLAGGGPGSELTTSEMSDLLSRTQQTLVKAYDLAIEDSDHSKKLLWALDSIDDAILSREFENFQLIARYVEIGLDNYSENRRAELITKFTSEYDVDSNHGRTQALSTICSSHALDLGLLDHCAKLLNHFGPTDANLRDSPAPDWSRAAISLMIGLTRDCSDHTNWLLHGPYWWNVRPCIADHHRLLASNIRELLDRFTESSNSAEKEALEAFLRLDETSDERFLLALELDNSMVVYASRLSKRLHRLGDVETASNVLRGIDAEMRSELPSSEKDLLDNTASSLKDGIYENWLESSWEL